MESTIEKLWEHACNGEIEELKKYYKEGEGLINQRYCRRKRNNSLIMGAFRNNQLETVEYLMSVGEDITDEERAEINKELKRIELLQKLCR